MSSHIFAATLAFFFFRVLGGSRTSQVYEPMHVYDVADHAVFAFTRSRTGLGTMLVRDSEAPVERADDDPFAEWRECVVWTSARTAQGLQLQRLLSDLSGHISSFSGGSA